MNYYNTNESNSPTNAVRDAALALAAQGFRVFPCTPGAKKPATPNGCKNATREAREVSRLFTNPRYNLGIATGNEGLIVLDFDAPDGLQKFEQANSPLPPTVQAQTPRGGRHVYLRVPTGVTIRNSTGKLAEKVDVRGIGGYVVACPSVVNGQRYCWIEGCAPGQIKIAPAPDWLLSQLTPRRAHPANRTGRSQDPEVLLRQAVARATIGQRNHVGFELATNLRDAGLTREEALCVMNQYAEQVPQNGDRPYTREEAVASLESAFSQPPGENEQGRRRSASALLKYILPNICLWHDQNKQTYATIKIEGHQENWLLRGPNFARFVKHLIYINTDEPLKDETWNAMRDVLEAEAQFKCPCHTTAIRLAKMGDAIYLDLANENWRVVRVTADGWNIINAEDCPIKFLRTSQTGALPDPEGDGDLNRLGRMLNLPNHKARILVFAWLLGVFQPDQPQVVLSITGEQGSAKTTTVKLLQTLIDPNAMIGRRPPKNEEDLFIAAKNGFILSFDNLSQLTSWMSDALCNLATGGGIAKRKLYTDDEECIIHARRPIILNGISDVASRPDLLERCICIHLSPIGNEHRRTEDEIMAEFREAHPRLLGALLTIVSVGLRNLPHVTLDCLPRMADFAKWILACEPAMPLSPGDFMVAYNENISTQHLNALESSLLAEAVRQLLENERKKVFECDVTTLLSRLNNLVDLSGSQRKYWPNTPRGLISQLQRIMPNLRAIGIHVEDIGRDPTTRRRKIRFSKMEGTVPQTDPDKNFG